MNETNVPFLSKLPLLGGIFRTSNKSKANTEIIIFITPTLISPVEEKGNTSKRQK
jgi:type II secretory pathway component GspD/PulD (secretin)